MNSFSIKFLTKSGCCLCDRGLFLIKRVKMRYNIEKIEVLDINKFAEYKKYSTQIPVLLINEEIVDSLKLNERKICEFIEKKCLKSNF